MIEEDIINTDDNELIMLYHEEDEDAKNILFYKYKFIIDILMKKYNSLFTSMNVDYQEIYSECTVGFSDGLRCYREDREASLPTFITLCIERRLGNLIKKYSRDKHKGLQNTYSLDFAYEDSDIRLMDVISDDCLNEPLTNMTEQEDYLELIKEIKNILTKSEYEVFVLKVRGLDYIEIAKILNKKPKQVDNAIQRIKNKIKLVMKKRETDK